MQDEQQQQLNSTSMTTHNSNLPSILSIQSKKITDPNEDKIESQTRSLEKNNDEKCEENESKSIPEEKNKLNDAQAALRGDHASGPNKGESCDEENGRERLKRHRVEVAGHVWIPDIWGQEELLKDWIDCSAFDASLMNSNISSARAALVEERRRANSTCRLGIENSC